MIKPSDAIKELMRYQKKTVNEVIQTMEIDRLTFFKLMNDQLIFDEQICSALKDTFGHREYYWKSLYENFERNA